MTPLEQAIADGAALLLACGMLNLGCWLLGIRYRFWWYPKP